MWSKSLTITCLRTEGASGDSWHDSRAWVQDDVWIPWSKANELPAMDDYSAAHKEQNIPDNLNNPADIQRSAPGGRACRQQLEEAQRQQRKRLPLEDSSRTCDRALQTKIMKSKTRERWTWQGESSKVESSAVHANYQSRGGSVDGEPVVKSAFV